MRWIFLLSLLWLFSGCAPQPTATQPCLSAAQLNGYSYDALARVAALVKEDSQKIDDFSLFVNTMKGNVENYSTLIQSSTYASNAIRFLPIPYAGEVSTGAKLVSGTLLNLNGAATSLERYRQTSAAFLKGFERLDRRSSSASDLAALAAFADTKLLADAADLHTSLQKISASAAALSATAQTLSMAMETGQGYVNTLKSSVGMGSNVPKEKARLDEGRDSLKTRLAALSQKIRSLENSAESHRQNIAKARIYAELALQTQGSPTDSAAGSPPLSKRSRAGL